MSSRKLLPIRWMKSASEDLNSIADYLLAEGVSFGTVEDYIQRLYNAPKHLASLPGAGKPGRVYGTREWLVKDTPYTLVYLVHDNIVRILRVMHSSRQFPKQ